MTRYDHPTPLETVFEPSWMPDLLFRTAARLPDAPAIDFMGAVISYGELASRVRKAAAGFRAIGVGPGSTVGLFLPNCPQYVIAAYGAWTAGARLANFSPLYTVDELCHQVEDSEADVMVTLDVKALLPSIEAVLKSTRLKTLVIGNVAEALPPVKSALYRLFKRGERSRFDRDDQHIPFASLLSGPEFQLQGLSPTPDEVALQLARAKALYVSARNPAKLVIGSDQTMSLGIRVYHKPKDMAAAKDHLLSLSANTHRLNSAVAFARDGEVVWEHVAHADMTVRPLTEEFVRRHLGRVGD